MLSRSINFMALCFVRYPNLRLQLQLAQKNTPIHQWSLPNIPNGFEVSIKRDDMTGSVLGGNKVGENVVFKLSTIFLLILRIDPFLNSFES